MTSPRIAACIALLAGCYGAPEEDVAAQLEELRVCADGDTVPGIDVSYWQQGIDWDRVAGAGVKFAFIRAGHGLEADTFFDRNWRGAKRVGILRGAYHYLEPDLDIDRQADIMIAAMATLEPTDLPPVLDIEDRGGLSASQIVTRAQRWIDRVQDATGRQVIIYTGKYFWQDNVGASDAFVDHPLWVPQYGPTCPDLPEPWREWAFFQTSNTGRVAGISGNVDLDLFNGSMEELRAFAMGVPCTDCPVCDPVPAEGRVIDDGEVCFRAGGDPMYWRRESAGHEGSLIWTYTVDGETTYNFAVWNLDVAEAGTYAIEVHTPAPFGGSRLASYRVMAGGTEERFPLDQTAVDGWSMLGEVELAAGGEQWVRVDDNTGEARDTNTQIVVDAIRLTRTDLPPVDPPVDPPAEGDAGLEMPGPDAGMGYAIEPPPGGMVSGGCSATERGGRSALPIAWAILLLVWVRRAFR